jgi:hypothetical protein
MENSPVIERWYPGKILIKGVRNIFPSHSPSSSKPSGIDDIENSLKMNGLERAPNEYLEESQEISSLRYQVYQLEKNICLKDFEIFNLNQTINTLKHQSINKNHSSSNANNTTTSSSEKGLISKFGWHSFLISVSFYCLERNMLISAFNKYFTNFHLFIARRINGRKFR